MVEHLHGLEVQELIQVPGSGCEPHVDPIVGLLQLITLGPSTYLITRGCFSAMIAASLTHKI